MKFSMIFLLEWPADRKTQAQVYAETLDQIQRADELGWDEVWIAEHHFSSYGLCPNIAVFAAAVAQRTKRIRIGSGVVVTPFHNPLRIAEDWAMVDILSGGRLDLGLGRGYQQVEYNGFQIPQSESKERFQEALDILKLAWQGEPFSYHGKHWQIDQVMTTPQPVQKPHPPLYVAAVSPDSYENYGRQGLPVLASVRTAPLPRVRQLLDTHRAALRSAGHDPEAVEYPIVYPCYCAETNEAAYNDVQAETLWLTEGGDIRKIGPDPNQLVDKDFAFYRKARERIERTTFDDIWEHPGTLYGDPDRVTERLRQLEQALGITMVISNFGFGGMDLLKARRSMELFAREVMPRFRSALPEAGAETAAQNTSP